MLKFKIKETTVRIMRSYDYNHFEVSLTADIATKEEVEALRAEVARLADKAVEDYKKKIKLEAEEATQRRAALAASQPLDDEIPF